MKRHAANAAVSIEHQPDVVVSTHDAPANETGKDASKGAEPGLSLERRVALTLEHLKAIENLWPGLVALTDDQRRASPGRHIGRYASAFQTLFTVAGTAPYSAVFALLGNQDGKAEGGTFDAAELLGELGYIGALRQVSSAVKKLDTLLDDDLMYRGERVVVPGLKALDIARSLARNNAHFRAKVANVLNEFKSMTARARRSRATSDESVDENPGADAMDNTPDNDP